MADDDTPDTDEVDDTPEKPAAEMGDAGKKALDKERRARRDAERKARELEERLTAIEDKDKTDAERFAAKLADAEDRAARAESKALRLEVAQSKGLTAAQAKRLVGDTQEELEADADEILEAFPAAGATPPPSKDPVTDLRGGSDPTTGDDIDVKALVDSIPPT